MKEVKGFFGEYKWLSNFYPCKVIYKGMEFPSSEHAFQYAKHNAPTHKDYQHILNLNAAQVKKWGRHIPLRKDWNKYRFEAMRQIVSNKFTENVDLRKKLAALRGVYLEETNYWNDTFWGVCKERGQNHLGKILMAIANLQLWDQVKNQKVE